MRVLFVLLLVSINNFSQEISEIYELKKDFKGNCLSGKVILYENGKYFRKICNVGHQLESYEEKGIWYKKKDTLVLNMEKLISFPEFQESKWVYFNRKDTFVIKRKRIVPVFLNKLNSKFALSRKQ